MRKSQQKPWLNKDGRNKSDAELKRITPNWKPGVWEDYLTTLEVRRKEDCVLPAAEMDTFSTDQHISTMLSVASEQSLPLLKVVINACIRELAPRQRDVVIRHYWDGKTIAEIATSMGVSKQSVRKTMKTALAKIKMNLASGSFRKRVMAAKEMLAS